MKGLNFLASVDEDQLQFFPLTKAQKFAPKTKKEKKAAKRLKMRTEIEARNGIRDEDSSIEPEKAINGKPALGNVESIQRRTFTKGWMESFSEKEALPTKQQGKVVRTVNQIKEENSDEGENSDAEEGVVFSDGFRAVTYPDHATKKKNGDEDEEDSDDDDEDDEGDYEFVPDLVMDKDDENVASSILATQKKVYQKVLEKVIVPGDENSVRAKKASSTAKFLGGINQYNARSIIGDICTTVTADPEKSFRKKRDFSDDGETPMYNFSDLLSVLSHPDMQIVELAMLSCLLAFKDILPGYRIRPTNEAEKDVILKKETKRLRDYENAILGAYQRYLKFLDGKTLSGLRNPRKAVPVWDLDAKLGLSALRCQCELLRAVPHFNYRTLLLNAVISRAAQPEDDVTEVCCGTLDHLFKGDNDGEASFEAVRMIGKVIMTCKYDVPAGLIRVLSAVKLRVHADQAKGVRRKAKQERRKRKKDTDDVESALLEANPMPEKSNNLRFQADSLHEICLIFFRVIKMKVGFSLMPVALEGLGRISHLINIDTVEDLVILMKTVLTSSPPAPPLVQLHCIHCALKTLAGPGEELKMDDEVFVSALRVLVKEIPNHFERWDVALDCLDLSLCKRRESRSNVVLGFVRLLYLHSSQMMSDSVGLALLAMANTVLLKYPRVRGDMFAPLSNKKKDDDEVADLAMKALRGADAASQEEEEGDGSWLLSLLKVHVDPRYARTVTALTSKDVTTIPMRLVEAKYDLLKVSSRVESVFNSIPSSITSGKKGRQIKGATTITKLSKIQEKNARRKSMKNGGVLLSKKTRSNFALDATALYFQTVNENIQRVRINKLNASQDDHTAKKMKIV